MKNKKMMAGGGIMDKKKMMGGGMMKKKNYLPKTFLKKLMIFSFQEKHLSRCC